MAIDRLKKGSSAEMLILLLLRESDMHGYQIAHTIENRSDGILIVQEGTLYPLLYRLTDSGYVSCYEVKVTTKAGRSRNRVMYHLEDAGKEKLRIMREEYALTLKAIEKVITESEAICRGQ